MLTQEWALTGIYDNSWPLATFRATWIDDQLIIMGITIRFNLLPAMWENTEILCLEV